MPYKNPETARAYQRDYKRLHRAGECQTPSTTQLPTEFRLRRAADVLAVVEEQIDAVRNEEDAGTLEKARMIGYLAGVALKAIDAGNLAARIEALESVLKQRNGKARQ